MQSSSCPAQQSFEKLGIKIEESNAASVFPLVIVADELYARYVAVAKLVVNFSNNRRCR